MAQLHPGDLAPTFRAMDQTGVEHVLEDHLASGKRVLLYFYPADDTPGCTKQACDFRDAMPEFDANDILVLGVSRQGEASHRKFVAKYDLNFPLLIDEDRTLHEAYGTWGEKMMYGKVRMGVKRSTFLIETDGTLAEARYNVRASGHVDMIRRLIGI